MWFKSRQNEVVLGASVEVDGKFYAIKELIAGFADGFLVGFSQLLTLDLATGKATFVQNNDASAGTIFGAAPAPAGVAISAGGALQERARTAWHAEAAIISAHYGPVLDLEFFQLKQGQGCLPPFLFSKGPWSTARQDTDPWG